MPDISYLPWSENLRSLAMRYDDRPAVIDPEGRTTHRELSDYAHLLARRLGASGLTANARVGVLLANGVDAVAADYGVTLFGGCLVHLNPAYTIEELRWAVHIAPVEVILTSSELADKASALGVPLLLCAPEQCPAPAEALPPVSGDFESRIVFTSGTSGKPKAVLYDHARRWLGTVMLRATLPFVPGKDSRILLMTPYVHGASMLARAWIDAGGSAVLMRGVNVDEIRRLLAAGEVDAMFAPPTVLSKLVESFAGETFDTLRCIFTGTQILGERLYGEARAIFGPCVRVTYGKSENLNPITVLDCEDTDLVYTSAAGAPSEGVCVGHPASGVEIAISASREVLIRSQHGFCGYLSETGLQRHDRDEWHATGDLGYTDAAGRLWLVGRNSEVINTGGYKVHPEEIEAVLLEAPLLREAYVVGMPSTYWSEVVVCVYVGDPAAPASLDEILQSLSGYKRPRCFVRVDEVEKTALGKVNRKALQRHLLQHYELVDGPRPRLQARTS